VAETVLEIGAVFGREREGERLGADLGDVEDGAGGGADQGQGGVEIALFAQGAGERKAAGGGDGGEVDAMRGVGIRAAT
jgi:hypothetical protein